MTSLWDLSDEQRKQIESIGVDWDLSACLEYNPQEFNILDIMKVLAVWEGENDEDDWRWIIEVKPDCAKNHKGKYVFLQGGCDYTGWDCQSWATSEFTKTKKQALELSKGTVKLNDSSPMDAGLGHMLNMMSSSYSDFDVVYESMKNQLNSKKNTTWREETDKEFNLDDLDKIK